MSKRAWTFLVSIHSHSPYLLRSYYVPGAVTKLGAVHVTESSVVSVWGHFPGGSRSAVDSHGSFLRAPQHLQ